jgi:hypothetical protein
VEISNQASPCRRTSKHGKHGHPQKEPSPLLLVRLPPLAYLQSEGKSPILYLIRHGEKPPKLPNGEDDVGLSTQGVTRAQGLVKVFGRTSPYNIGYIIAQKPKKRKLKSPLSQQDSGL